jgi:hypothetical protein
MPPAQSSSQAAQDTLPPLLPSGEREEPPVPCADEDVLADLQTLFAPTTSAAPVPEVADPTSPQDGEGVASVALPMQQALSPQTERAVCTESSTATVEASQAETPT